MLRMKRAACLAAILVAAACTDHAMSPTAPTGPRETISDAAHAGTVPGFYFLPPMVDNPSYSGTFDAALQPRVEICELVGTSCGSTIATFTFGTGGGNVRLESNHYIANWHTKDYNLDVSKNYRISVYQGAFLLGFADVDVVGSGKDLKNVDTGQFIALLDDRTLPIKFRIETGIPAAVAVSPALDSINVGETAQFTATCTDLHGNTVPCPATTWSSSNTAVATVDGTGLATGVDAGTVTITASIGYASGTATLVVIQPNTPPVANDDAFEAIGNVTIPVAAPGVLANDTDAETPGGLSVVPGTVATSSGGSATLAADGSFTYLSGPGFTGGDTFTYTVTDGSLTASATVTMTSTARVWYVDNSAAGPGDGRDASPFSTLAAAEGPPTTGETIFLLYGNGTSAGYDAGFTFENGQSLIGQGVPADVTAIVNGSPLVLLDAGSAPTVTNAAAGATLRLASNNVVQGMNVNSTAGAGISGSAFGTLAVSSVDVAAIGGPSVDLQTGTMSASFGSLSSAASTGAGLRLVGVGGTLTAPAGIVTGAAGAGVEVSGGDANVTYGGSINGSGTRAASVTGRTGGTLTLSGSITDTNGGILAQNNTGGTIAFNGSSKALSTGANTAVTLSSNAGATVNFGGGGLAIATAGATGFSASGGGTVNVTGANNTIATTSGTALSVVNTGIGASGLSFLSISASNDGSGIVLNNTGAVNGLQVTGSGVAGSGGTIAGMSGDGVSLTSATSVRLAWMTIQNNLGNGIFGSSVTDVRVENASVLNNADNAATDEAGIRFDNLFGTSAINNTTVAGSIEDNVRVENSSGVLTQLSVSGSTIRDNTASAPGRHGLFLSATGGANMTVVVQNSHFLRNRISGVEANTNGAGVLDVSVTGGSLQNNSVGVNLVHNSTGALTYDVLNIPTITGHTLTPINVNRLNTAGAASTFAGTISGNVIGAVGVPNSGNSAGPGIRVQSGGVGGTLTTAITNNTIREVTGRGVDLLVRDGSGTLNATVTGNTIVHTSALSLEGIRFDSGALSTDQTKACAAISGNSITTVGGFNAIRLRQRFLNTTFDLAGYAGSPVNDAAVAAFLVSTNTVANAAADHGGAGFNGVVSCPTP
jgi:hypothetical protein